jgi:SLAP domain-containing protein
MGLAAALLAASAATALAADDVVVLKGGTVIALKQPWVRKGNTAYLTKKDGTILSVSVSEIDRDATDAARARQAAPKTAEAKSEAAPATPADAVRAKEDNPKARVRITDADVSHPMDLSDPSVTGKDDKDKKDLAPGSARVEVSTFDQKKEGDALIVSGKLRNPTQETAENVRMNVTVLDPKGELIESGPASLSNGEIDPGSEVDFQVKIPVGDKTPGTVRFAPTWAGPKPAAPAKGAKPPKIQAPSQAAAPNP